MRNLALRAAEGIDLPVPAARMAGFAPRDALLAFSAVPVALTGGPYIAYAEGAGAVYEPALVARTV